jgi:DNA mismatch repair enzyme (predicted ATPase)
MKNILISPEGIQKNLKNIKPLDAICEYIWNGFDANATYVKVVLNKNEFGIINSLSIIDNGTGIIYDELEHKFQPFNESNKAESSSRANHSIPHGRQGIGRLTFFSFAQTAKWETVYSKNNDHYKYYIEMDKDSLNKYDDNNGNSPSITSESNGTKVTFTQINTMSEEEIFQRVKEEFFWFLELNKDNGYKIWIDDEIITYEDLVVNRFQVDFSKYDLKQKYEVRIIQWNISLGNEYSKFYFIGSDNKERYKEATKLNKKSDEFYHSIYIKSDYFNDFCFNTKQYEGQIGFIPNKNEQEYKDIIEVLNRYLTKLRKVYLKEASDRYIEGLIQRKVYPEFNTTNFMDNYRKQELNHLVETLYMAQPKIFTGLSDDNKKITIHLLKLIMENSNKPELFEVLKQVIELDEDELCELAEVLKHSSLSNITKVIKLLEDRLKVVQGLKELVFRKDLFAKEVPHIQSIIENHYWLFGEQYSLITAAEPDFELALKGLILAETGENKNVYIHNDDKNKEMDIYMIRQDRRGNITENVVVELKRPTVPLGEDQLSQVKRYMRVIKSDDRFNATNVKWTYFLVGNRLNENGYIEGELESHKNYGEPHLIHSDSNGNNKIYVLTWSDIFDDFSKRHEFLMSKLDIEQKLWLQIHTSADEIVKDISINSATLAKPIIPKKQLLTSVN